MTDGTGIKNCHVNLEADIMHLKCQSDVDTVLEKVN